jgi:hypothetical protein
VTKKPAVKTAKKPKHIWLLCGTTVNGNSGPDYAIICMTVQYVAKLIARHGLTNAMHRTDPALEACEYQDSEPEFYDKLPDSIDPEIPDMFHSMELGDDGKFAFTEYQPLPDDFVLPNGSTSRIAYRRLVMTPTHLYWVGALKDVSGEFETPIMPIEWLKELAKQIG